MNGSGLLNCHNLAFRCPHFFFFFKFVMYFVISFSYLFETCEDALSLARESIGEKKDNKTWKI